MKTYIKRDNEIFKVRDTEIEISSDFRFDTETNEKVFDETLDNIAINKAFDEYRKINDMLTSKEIKNIREKYKLSQRDFALITGLGKATISRYEKGALPSKVNNNFYKNIDKDLNEISTLIKANSHKLEERIRNKLLQRIKELKKVETDIDFSTVESIFVDKESNIMNGYKKLDISMVENVITYYANRISNVSKTKLNKLLFYTDFIHFESFAQSFTGLTYIKNHYGPVPNKSELLYGLLAEEGTIVWVPFRNCQGEYIESNKGVNSESFSNNELKVLERVVELFDRDNANEISEKSHEEKAWIETQIKEVIPYSYADVLKYK